MRYALAIALLLPSCMSADERAIRRGIHEAETFHPSQLERYDGPIFGL